MQKYMTIEAVAKTMEEEGRTIRNWIKTGIIPRKYYIRISRKYKMKPSVIKFLEDK